VASTQDEIQGQTTPADRACYYDPDNFFMFKWPDVPRRQFLTERDRAFSPDSPTGEVLLDSSDALQTDYPATTPLLLARYLRIRATEKFSHTRRASAELYYVLEGRGQSRGCGESIQWVQGDAFCFPGGVEVEHSAATDAVIFAVSNEPLLRYDSLQPPTAGKHDRVAPVHWLKTEMDAHLEAVYARPTTAESAGSALQLATAAMAPARYPIPTINAAINTLAAGGDQRAHRHNGAAITLAIQGEGVYSKIEDQQVNWSDGAVQVTPATEFHSHHNRGDKRGVALVIQDEGLHFYARTPGFSWD
jgi:gentisate 1,2-dioxygenase